MQSHINRSSWNRNEFLPVARVAGRIGSPQRRNNEGGGGGKRASAIAVTVHWLGLSTDETAGGRAKGGTTCRCVKQGGNCPEAGQVCPCNRRKPKAPAALAPSVA
eukprot:5678983-Pyramimonas_sp.AAC.1